jgi:3-carboxy-cis,cis-muconate cycloisomerase
MPGRTWLQQAVPVTFGLKAAGFLDAFLRHRRRLEELRPRVLVVQFGGAAGTLASLGGRGDEVARALAQQLGLATPTMPWHAHRDRIGEVAAFHGLVVGTLGKLGRDVSLGMQTELGEIAEPDAKGRGESSTMPHKRNPVSSAILLAAAIRVPGLVGTVFSAMVQEHERGLGGWHAEWETLPEICTLTLGSLERAAEFVPHLRIDEKAMRRDLDSTHGLLMAESVSMRLAEQIGRARAHALVEDAARKATERGIDFIDALKECPQITAYMDETRLRELLEPSGYLGSAQLFVDRVLAEYRSPSGKQAEES